MTRLRESSGGFDRFGPRGDGPTQRQQLSFQTFSRLEKEPPVRVRDHQWRDRLLARADVRAAIDAVGRVGSYPVYLKED